MQRSKKEIGSLSLVRTHVFFVQVNFFSSHRMPPHAVAFLINSCLPNSKLGVEIDASFIYIYIFLQIPTTAESASSVTCWQLGKYSLSSSHVFKTGPAVQRCNLAGWSQSSPAHRKQSSPHHETRQCENPRVSGSVFWYTEILFRIHGIEWIACDNDVGWLFYS